MASCEVGLGESILKKTGLAQIKNTNDPNDTITAFVNALQTQLDSFFKAGAIASARDLPCIDETSTASAVFVEPQSEAFLNVPKSVVPAIDESFQEQASPLKECPPTVTEAMSVAFTAPVTHRLASGITPLGIETFVPSPALFMLASEKDVKSCCKFFGAVTSFGDVKLKLNFTVMYGAIDVAVSVDLGYTTRIAGTTHRGFCNPPKVCRNESLVADILVTYTGKFNLKVRAEIDLGPLGKVQGGGAGLDLSAQGVDLVKCTLQCAT